MMVMKRRGKEDQAEVMREMKKKKRYTYDATNSTRQVIPVSPYSWAVVFERLELKDKRRSKFG
jgi:hypothetical protein